MDLLWLALGALVVSLIAGGLGFTGLAQGTANISRGLFGIFFVMFFVLLVLFLFGISLFA
jgi:uncharacterized membrane protein YtjA (UPF0391 family)